jgi:dienelactone hydrolase
MSSLSAACCSIPPIISNGYNGKGTYKTIAGLKTCSYTSFSVFLVVRAFIIDNSFPTPDVTGPPSATKAILLTYDIFGFFPQTIQGADILALSDKNHHYQVFVPDFFEGKSADISWYPPTTDAHGKALENFFGGIGAPSRSIAMIPNIVSGIKEYNSNIMAIGAMGMCWGGKVCNVSLNSSRFLSSN